MTTLELLAPAKNLSCGLAAIDHGADAVYIGAQRFGARASAGNSLEDITELCSYAHQYGVKVYVTVNTIIYDEELDETRKLLADLQVAGVDAFLVQDLGLVAFSSTVSSIATGLQPTPPITVPLHASTQTDNRSVEKVRWLRSLGFRRVVLARELSVDEIAEIHREVPDVELEVFVHGALCVSYSGICYASQYCFGRSANRGACAQFCRLKFDLRDSRNHLIEQQRHLLSLKDMCRIDQLEELIEAGAVSFKIEGRLKDEGYVKNVVSAYSQALNRIIARHSDRYCRASKGECAYTFTPNLKKTFNRGFTTYFLHGRQQDITSFDTPKAMGEYVGRVKEIRARSFTVAGTAAFANGDGLCFLNRHRELEGFRVNRAEGNLLFPLKMPEALRPGMPLYRNQDVAFEKILAGKTAERKIVIGMQFSATDDGFLLTLTHDGYTIATAKLSCEKQKAHKPQRENIFRQLTKLGNTPYRCDHIELLSDVDKYFISSSLLTELRRKAIASIIPADSMVSYSTVESYEAKQSQPNLTPPPELAPYMYNIANQQARAFYESQGVKPLVPAFELSRPQKPIIMQCRHCLRYALGYCVKHGGKKTTWREPLYLELSDHRRFQLQFDCNQCQMIIYAE